MCWWLASAVVFSAGVAIFDDRVYGGPLRTGYRPGEVTFGLGAIGPNLRMMPKHLMQAMPMLVLGLAALVWIIVRGLVLWHAEGGAGAVARRDLWVALPLAGSWFAIWGLYSGYTWTTDPTSETVQVVRFYVPAMGAICLLGAWLVTRVPGRPWRVALTSAVAIAAMFGLGVWSFYAMYRSVRRATHRLAHAIVRQMSSARVHHERVRVLVVEDHVVLADRIGEGLRDAGFAVDVVYDGATALESVASTDYDVVVLDRDLPVVHGDRVCRQLVRDGSPVRVLMLTAAIDVEDRVDGLELGADDYLGKPFAFQELIARIRALGRRGPGTPAIVQRGDLLVDRSRHRASRSGVPLTLTRKEFGVLEHLAAADGAPVSAEELLEHVWDAHADPLSNAVAVTVARLRRKLGDPPLIETVVGVGYRL